MTSLLKGVSSLLALLALTVAAQYFQRQRLNQQISALPPGSSKVIVKQKLGKPNSLLRVQDREVYCYYVGPPLTFFSPGEWRLEFDDVGLVRKDRGLVSKDWCSSP